MTSIRQITQNRAAAPGAARGGPQRAGRYVRNPAADAFWLFALGVIILLAVGLAVVVHAVWGIGRSDVVAIILAPLGAIALGAGLVGWLRRPRIADELGRIDDEWPLLEDALLRVVDRSGAEGSVMARVLVDYGFRTSTARRAILARFGAAHEHPRKGGLVTVDPECGEPDRDEARIGEPIDERPPRRQPVHLVHDAGNRPTRVQLTPDLRPATTRVFGGGLMLFGTLLAYAIGVQVGRLGPGSLPSALLLGALGATALFVAGVLDARQNQIIRSEVDRAVLSWGNILTALRAAEDGGRLPSAALQQLGYRRYEVRRAILRCAFRARANPGPTVGLNERGS